MAEKGKYIVIEGHDGTGKSTQVVKIRERLATIGIESVEFHEPEGTPISDVIRTVIKNGELERDGMTNLLLFSAARHEIWRQRALPALEIGQWVIASRNYYSTLAYQGYGEGLDLDQIEMITLAATDELYLRPDHAVILSLDDENERKKRIQNRGELAQADTFESRDDDFQTKVRDGYLEIAKNRNLPIVSSNQPIDSLTDSIWEHIEVR